MAKTVYIDENGNELPLNGTADDASKINYENTTVKTALDTINQNITNIHEWNLIGTISASPSVSTSATLNIPTNAKEMMLMLKDVGYDDVLDVEIVPMGYGNANGINLYFFSTSGSVYRLIITRNSNTFTVNNTSVANFEVKVFTR